MHILVIPSWYRSAEEPISGIFFRQQAQALHRAGFQVGVLYPHFRSLRLLRNQRTNLRPRFTWEIDEGVPTYRYEGWSLMPGFPKLFHLNWVRMGRLLFKRYLERFGKPDLIHAHSVIHGGVLAAQLQTDYKIPYVLTEHSSAYALGWFRPWHLPLAETCLRQAKARLVVSPALGKQLEKMFGAAALPWQWAPNLVDPRFAPNEQLVNQTPGQPFRFLNVGRLDENKRQGDLIRAFAERFKNHQNVQVRLVGDGPCRPQLEQLANTLGVGEQVIFLGVLDQVQVILEMQAANAVVVASQYETFGVVLIEALACGKPIISTACGGPEYIINEQNGLLVPINDVAALGAAMAQMVTTSDRYEPEKLRAACLDQFGEEAVVDCLYNVYQTVLATTTTLNFTDL
jgi:glycosyltransferase involved in cell wall biosynthesis